MSSASSSSSKLGVLSLLDAYSQIHERGQVEQKAGTWQLTVARRNKERHGALMVQGVLVAEDVREELRVIRVVKGGDTTDEPVLLDEDEGKKSSNFILPRRFVLADASAANAPNDDDDEGDASKENNTPGLRRRKGGAIPGREDAESKWLVEGADSEVRSFVMDPLDLFGAMPPKQLRLAQRESIKALASYVEAANLVAEIQQRLQQAKNYY